MATYRILSWQEIPAQVRVEDAEDGVTLELPPAFQARIDRAAMQRGLGSGDDYLEQWAWSDPAERPGTAREVAEALVRELTEGVISPQRHKDHKEE